MDILQDLGPIFLGSRLKRLGERMQVGAAQALAEAGLPTQPSHMPLLVALERAPLTVGQLAACLGTRQPGITRGVGQLVELGLVGTSPLPDPRRRALALTPAGRAALARARALVWPRVRAAVEDLATEVGGGLLAQIAGVEAALTARPLAARLGPAPARGLRLLDYDEALAQAFHDINAEWIGEMFRLEPTDREVLEQPMARIIAPGGAILFVEAEGLGVVGTCALQKTGPTSFELTKMGVRRAARGLKAGEFLLHAMIERARQLGAEPLYLLTNRHCAAAIHLYEKAGFRHDADIMARYGARYARCDVAMRYAGWDAPG